MKIILNLSDAQAKTFLEALHVMGQYSSENLPAETGVHILSSFFLQQERYFREGKHPVQYGKPSIKWYSQN